MDKHQITRYGEDNPQHKLTEAQVMEIYAGTGSHHETARAYGIARQTVGAIRSGERWAWLTGAQETTADE